MRIEGNLIYSYDNYKYIWRMKINKSIFDEFAL